MSHQADSNQTTSNRTTTLDIAKENLKFSGAHFTIFSATERERLHGHNFKIRATVKAGVDDNGMCFNYQEIKKRLRAVCEKLDEYLILAGNSPYLAIDETDTNYLVTFAGAQMQFLKSDTLILPIRNTTVEEFSAYILGELINSDRFFFDNDVHSLTIGASSGDGQWGFSSWDKP